MNVAQAQQVAETLLGAPGKKVVAEEWRGECLIRVITHVPGRALSKIVAREPTWQASLDRARAA